MVKNEGMCVWEGGRGREREREREREGEREVLFLVCSLDASSWELWEDSCEHVVRVPSDNTASFVEDRGNSRFYLYIQDPRFPVPLNSPNQGTIQSNVNKMINTENKLGVFRYLLNFLQKSW